MAKEILKKPDEWAHEFDYVVLDPDGWREPNAKAWDEPITRDEYEQRLIASTVTLRFIPSSVTQRCDQCGEETNAEDNFGRVCGRYISYEKYCDGHFRP